MTGSTSEIRKTLGENLRLLLIKHNKTIVETCTAIGINRTQFNKYLSGASSPRPEVLKKICDYFGVDARILLEPLHLQPTWNSGHALANKIAEQIKNKNCRIEDSYLPSGFYRQWLCSHTQPEMVYTSLVLIYTGETGIKIWKSRSRVSSNSLTKTSQDSSVVGAIFPQRNGLAVLKLGKDGDPVLFSYFKFGFNGFNRFFPGFSVAGHLGSMQDQIFRRAFIERIPQSTSDVLKIARTSGYLRVATVPDYAAEILRLKTEWQTESSFEEK